VWQEVSGVKNLDQNDVQSTLRDMWETRPGRRGDDRQVAGVAAAIARRYDIDPTLVRIGFVVATLSGGIGAALYIAGWIALPEEAGPVPVRPRRGIAVVGLVAGVAMLLGWWGDGPGAAPFLAAAIAVGLLFLLHRDRGDRGGAPATAGLDAPTVVTPTADGVTLTKETGPSFVEADAPAPESVATPPSWDPLGAAPFAWDLPEPSPVAAPAEPARRRLPVTPVTLGLALLAGGATAIILLLGGALTLPDVPVILGVLLATVGAGLLVGAFTRSGRGLIPIALLLSALTWGALSVPAHVLRSGDMGELNVRPLSVAQVQPVYQRSLGEVDVDLSQVDLSVPPGGDARPVRTRVEVGAGDVTVIVPPDADVTVDGSARVGTVEFADRSQDGTDIHLQETDLGEDGVSSGRPLLVDIDMGAGSAEVRRG
jgi:phage shock protein PspC (stress-responsive transcriptional regulator)